MKRLLFIAGLLIAGSLASNAQNIGLVLTCVGTPGNTIGAYLQQCQIFGTRTIYTCNNSAGCKVSSDWLLGQFNTTSQVVSCIGTPGNTSGTYLKECYANSVLYVCTNSAGCAVAADWTSTGIGLGGSIQTSGGGIVPSAQSLSGVKCIAWGDSITAGNEDGTTGIGYVSIVSGGINYVIGDIVTVTQSGASGGELLVRAISSGGVVTAVSIIPTNQGTGYAVASGLATTGGTGTGLTVTIPAANTTVGIVSGVGDSYPSYLTGMLGTTCLNMGVGGQTSTQIATQMLAAPQYWSYCSIIEAGRINYNSPTTVLADIASMVGALTIPKCFVVLGILNGTGETLSVNATNYNIILALNASLKAAYPNNYLDPRTALVSAFNPTNLEDYNNYSQDISPSSLRALLLQGTLTGSVISSGCSIGTTGSFLNNGDEIIIDSEKILVITQTGNNTVSTCTRGYNNTTAAAHNNSANVYKIDALHPGYNGYQLMAAQLAAWFTAPNSVSAPSVVGSSGSYPTGSYNVVTSNPGLFSNLHVFTISGPPSAYPNFGCIGATGQTVTTITTGSSGHGCMSLYGGSGQGDFSWLDFWDIVKNPSKPIAGFGAEAGGSGSLFRFFTSTTYSGGIGHDSFDIQYNQFDAPVYISSNGTKFTISGCSATTTVGGSAAGSFVSGTTGTCTVTITINGATGTTAPNGYFCAAADVTTTTDTMLLTASTATTATLSGTTVSGDVIKFGCVGY